MERMIPSRRFFWISLPALALLLSLNHTAYSQCSPSTSATDLDVNNVRARMLGGGDMFWDLIGTAQYEVPAGSGSSSLFLGSVWIGAQAGSQLKVAAQRYRSSGNDFWPGPVDDLGNVTGQTCNMYDRHWKVEKATIDQFVAGQLTNIPNEILEWPAKNNPNFAVGNQDLAPFVDVDGDGNYDPAMGDYPKIKGDQAIWWVINDVGNLHTETGGGQLGVQVQIMAYAYATSDHLNNTTFYEYKVINKSQTSYTDTYCGIFIDPDLGFFNDDLVGCDPSRNLGFCLNGDDYDESANGNVGYLHNPPVIGVKILEGINPAPNQEFKMTSFLAGTNSTGPTGDPGTAHQFYNNMKGVWNDGTPLTMGGNGYSTDPNAVPTQYAYEGNPCENATWSDWDYTPTDRRFLMGMGPFDLGIQRSQTFTYAIIWARDSTMDSNCPDMDWFFQITDEVQDFFDNSTDLPEPLSVDELDQDDQFRVFPNPSSGQVTLGLIGSEPNTPVEVNVFNAIGSRILSERFNGKQTFDWSDLPSGMYVLSLSTEDGREYRQKLILKN